MNMATTNYKRSLINRIDDEFVLVAFAESGELYPEHPHRVRSVTEVFTEVAFAESGEKFIVDVGEKKAPKLCVKGETPGGLCV